MKKTLCILFAALVLGLLAVRLFDRYLDSENLFWKETVTRSNAWAREIDARYPAKYVAAGGSSTRTSIDPALLLEEFNIPLVNAALHAGFGMAVHMEGALPYLRRGDTLILSLEPLLLSSTKSAKGSHGTTGAKFFATHLQTGLPHTELADWNEEDALRILRGNSYQIIVRILRELLFEKSYRYTPEELHESGWLEVQLRCKLATPRFPLEARMRNAMPTRWSLDFLRRIVSWGHEHGVRVIYALPRSYAQEKTRCYYAAFALRIMDVMPVLRDRALGADPDPDHFSDTINHANTAGTQLTTREWGRALAEEDFWTREELLDYLHSHGINEDGSPYRSRASEDTREATPNQMP